MPPPVPAALTREVGVPAVAAGLGGHFEDVEETAELQFPESVRTYDRMRRTDGQVASVMRAVTLPLRRTRWWLTGDDVDPRVVAFCETQLGLGPAGQGRRRRRRHGIDWSEHLRHVLLMLPLGFMPFEQVYQVGPPPDGTNLPMRQVAHLRKLAPRMPRSLSEPPLVAPDGGLAGIRQQVWRDGRWQQVDIGVDRLVMYVNDREGADWLGTSILRAAYKHWMIKDGLLRVGPQVVERNGMGVPVVTAPPTGSEQKALDLARRFRAGDEAGAGLPAGYTLTLQGVQGTLKDELPLVNYHDREIGRNALAMFLDLGHDRGARSLGETFLHFFLLALDAVADHVAEVTTEHAVRDLVEHNFGADEPYPTVAYDPIVAHAEPTAEALGLLVDAGLILPDDVLRGDVRRRYGLPEAPPPDPDAPALPDVPPQVEPSPWATSVDDLEARLRAALARLRTSRR